MADGSFRRVFRDEEHHREEYLDRQLEVGWEDDPADRLLEPADHVGADPFAQAGDETGVALRHWRRQALPARGRRTLRRAVSAMRRNASGS